MTRIVDVQEAETHLSTLLQDVERGEEILIGRAGTPVARLIPYRQEKRQLGLEGGQIWIADDFDETPADIVEDFYR